MSKRPLMTSDLITRARALLTVITPWPWYQCLDGRTVRSVVGESTDTNGAFVCHTMRAGLIDRQVADAALIAEAPALITEFIEVLLRLIASEDQLSDQVAVLESERKRAIDELIESDDHSRRVENERDRLEARAEAAESERDGMRVLLDEAFTIISDHSPGYTVWLDKALAVLEPTNER